MPPWRPIVLGCAVPIFWSVAVAAYGANDSAVHVPPLYNTFVPPAVGASYLDQVYGTSIKRLSDAVNMPNNAGSGELLWVSTEYSTASAFNSNNSRLILQHQGYYGLYDGNGTYLRDLPFVVNAATEPRWSRTDPSLLYYVSGNDLMRLDVPTGTSSLVHSFGEYATIRGRGESDISRDGDHFVFAADEIAGLANRYVFVYEISTDTKGPVLDTSGHAFNNLYIAPNNSVAIGWIPTGTGRFTGVELFDRNMVFQRQLTHAIGHMHLTRDTNGDDVLVWNNSNDPLPIACANGIVKVRLANAQQTCLLPLDWSLAVHITAGDGDGWAFVETYDPTNPIPAAPGWKPYTNEILQVKLDGTETRRLFHHRSRPFNTYEYQPRATVSRDGSRLVYTSNYDLQAILGYSNVYYTDAYLVAVPPMALSCPTTVTPGGSFTTTVTGGSSATDWVAMYPGAQAANNPWLTYQYVPLPRPQTLTFTAPATLGTYGLRLFANNGYTLLGSCQFLVAAGPSLRVSDVTVTEGNAGTVNANFTVTLSPAAGSPVTVAYATANGTAIAGTDYVATSGTLSFAPGDPPKTVTVLVNGDTIPEPTETFFLNLSNPVGATIGDGQGQGTVTNDEGPLSCPAPVAPGASFTTTVTSGSSATDWVAMYPAAQAANTPWLTYQYAPLPRPQTLTFTAPATPGTYELRLFANNGYTLLGSCQFPVSVGPSLSVSDVTVTEGNAGTVNANFNVTVSPAAAGTVTVAYATANGTATSGSDYVAASGTLTFAPGDPPKTVTVLVNGDSAAEPNETFFLNLSNPTGGATIGDAQGQGTIANDEAPLSCPTAVSPGASFTTTVTAGASATDWVAMYPAAQAANNPWITYQYVPLPRPRTLTFTAPAMPGTYTLRLFANNVYTLLGACQFPVAAGGPSLSVSDVTVGEGNAGTLNASFTVMLSPAAAGTVTVGYATANGTASAGSDYVATNGTLTFAPGDPPRTVTVLVNGDTTAEANETFFLNLSNPTGGATIGDGQGQGTITNDDAPLTCPTTVSPGASFTTTVTGGSSATDWVALTTPAAPNTSYMTFQYVPLPRPQVRTFTAPATPGTYALRLFANNVYTLLGACQFTVAVGP